LLTLKHSCLFADKIVVVKNLSMVRKNFLISKLY